MKIVESKIENLSANLILQKNSVVVLGFFDGVHIGHQKIFEEATQISRRYNLNLNVITFNKKISHIKENKAISLMSDETKRQYLNDHYPISIYIELIVDDYLMNMHHLEFLVWLQTRLKAKKIVVGNNFHYGKNQKGTIEDIQEVFGYNNVIVIETKQNKISSSIIRQNLHDGDLNLAQENLGHKLIVELALAFENEKWIWKWNYPEIDLKSGTYHLIDINSKKNWTISYNSRESFQFLDENSYKQYPLGIHKFEIEKD